MLTKHKCGSQDEKRRWILIFRGWKRRKKMEGLQNAYLIFILDDAYRKWKGGQSFAIVVGFRGEESRARKCHLRQCLTQALVGGKNGAGVLQWKLLWFGNFLGWRGNGFCLKEWCNGKRVWVFGTTREWFFTFPCNF